MGRKGEISLGKNRREEEWNLSAQLAGRNRWERETEREREKEIERERERGKNWERATKSQNVFWFTYFVFPLFFFSSRHKFSQHFFPHFSSREYFFAGIVILPPSRERIFMRATSSGAERKEIMNICNEIWSLLSLSHSSTRVTQCAS